MYKIKVNGILYPFIFWSLSEAIDACRTESAKAVSAVTKIVRL